MKVASAGFHLVHGSMHTTRWCAHGCSLAQGMQAVQQCFACAASAIKRLAIPCMADMQPQLFPGLQTSLWSANMSLKMGTCLTGFSTLDLIASIWQGKALTFLSLDGFQRIAAIVAAYIDKPLHRQFSYL